MDAAVSEDLKIQDVQNQSSTRPALDFFLLKKESVATGLDSHLDLREVCQEAFQKYKSNGVVRS
jgi:hypothetical protein